MRGLAVLALFLGLAVIVGIMVWWVRRDLRRAEEQARLLDERNERRRAAIPWKYYSRPDTKTGEWVVGVQRVDAIPTPREVLDDVEIARLPAAHLVGDRLDAEGEAIVQAQLYNGTKSEMT